MTASLFAVSRPGRLSATARRLLAARTLRSVGQGALVVDFALYLKALHWSAAAIGVTLSGGALLGAVLSVVIGVLSDRAGRRKFLLGYETLMAAAGCAALLTSNTPILACAAVLGGFGRGAIGAAGPFAPAEQAWLAQTVAAQHRGPVYSLNAALGFFGMGGGALLASAPIWLERWLPGAGAYRPLFALVVLTSLTNLLLLYKAREKRRRASQARDHAEHRRMEQLRRRENGLLWKLVFANAFNGAAIGLTGPLIAYWFAVRFQIGPGAIAPVMAGAFFITGVLSLLAGRLSARIGLVRSVLHMQSVGLVLLILLPLMPSYWLAAAVYILRSALNRSPVGARQALSMGLVRDQRRGLATSLNAASVQFSRSLGPSIAGYLLDAGYLALPFYIAALLQGVHLVLYRRFFKAHNFPPTEPASV